MLGQIGVVGACNNDARVLNESTSGNQEDINRQHTIEDIKAYIKTVDKKYQNFYNEAVTLLEKMQGLFSSSEYIKKSWNAQVWNCTYSYYPFQVLKHMIAGLGDIIEKFNWAGEGVSSEEVDKLKSEHARLNDSFLLWSEENSAGL